MSGVEEILRAQLVDRRARLRESIATLGSPADLVRLLQQVDSALARMDDRSYGLCEICDESIDEPDLLANPLARYCLCRLSPPQLDALQHDLDLAGRIQAGLLPPPDFESPGWQIL